MARGLQPYKSAAVSEATKARQAFSERKVYRFLLLVIFLISLMVIESGHFDVYLASVLVWESNQEQVPYREDLSTSVLRQSQTLGTIGDDADLSSSRNDIHQNIGVVAKDEMSTFDKQTKDENGNENEEMSIPNPNTAQEDDSRENREDNTNNMEDSIGEAAINVGLDNADADNNTVSDRVGIATESKTVEGDNEKGQKETFLSMDPPYGNSTNEQTNKDVEIETANLESDVSEESIKKEEDKLSSSHASDDKNQKVEQEADTLEATRMQETPEKDKKSEVKSTEVIEGEQSTDGVNPPAQADKSNNGVGDEEKKGEISIDGNDARTKKKKNKDSKKEKIKSKIKPENAESEKRQLRYR